MAGCKWPGACPQPVWEAGLCTYHHKVSTGFITSTRAATAGSSSSGVTPIVYPTPKLGARAAAAQRRYTDEVLVPIWHRAASH